MNITEETIAATLDASGQLVLSHPPKVPAGPVQVTIRAAGVGATRTMASVLESIASDQRRRGFPGRSADEVKDMEAAQLRDDLDREQKLDDARRASPGAP